MPSAKREVSPRATSLRGDFPPHQRRMSFGDCGIYAGPDFRFYLAVILRQRFTCSANDRRYRGNPLRINAPITRRNLINLRRSLLELR